MQGANAVSRSRSASTPSRCRPEPKMQGKSLRSLIRPESSAASAASPCRKRSIASSLQRAICSSKSSARMLKSTQFSSSRVRRSSISAASSAPARSILVINKNVGIPCLFSSRQSVSVCACTPSLPEITRTAQSSTGRVRSISAEKSTCPGVSSRVSNVPDQSSMACLEKMVIPRSRSRLCVSRKLLRWSTRPSFFTVPER